jgi:hypothetical protein
MHNPDVRTTPRRSSRVPITVPILVTSLDPSSHFSEVCETLVVSAHGCSMRSPMKVNAGAQLHFHSKEGRETTARVVYCQPIESDQPSWRLGATLDRPENFWGLKACPKDWTHLPVLAAPSDEEVLGASSATRAPDKLPKQLSDGHLRAIMAEFVGPLQAEVTELKDKLAVRESKRGRLEVSLSQIPSELEQQLEHRLRKELGPRVLEQARAQSAEVLEAAKVAIDHKTTETHDQFVQRVAQELQAAERKAQDLSASVGENLRERLNRELGEFHQQVADAGDRLKKLSENFLAVLQQKLGKDHEGLRRELEQVQARIAEESSRLTDQLATLDSRIGALDASARRLESGLEGRLAQMASDTTDRARIEMDRAVDVILKDAETRSTRGLASQIEEATQHLKIIQKGIEASASESLRVQVAEGMRSFEHSLEELAQQSVERWRLALAGGLSTLATSLSEQLRPEVPANGTKR